MSLAESEAVHSNVPPGWYPDPTQPATQRYWDGTTWTDQRAPLAPQPQGQRASVDSASLALGLAGAGLAALGTFLPAAESQQVLTIANNTLIQTGDGWIVVLLAVAAGVIAYRRRFEPGRNPPLIVIAVVLGILAIAAGSNMDVRNGLGQSVTTTPGVGIYAIAAGAVLVLISGLIDRGRTSAG